MVKLSDFNKWAETPNGRQVISACTQIAFELKAQGKKRGINAIAEDVRYSGVDHDDEGYRVCNNWKPLMARKIMKDNPELDGYFRCNDMFAFVDDTSDSGQLDLL